MTVHKDSTGHIGVVVKKGKIVSLAKDSSAARNGLLTHHYICEVNGQNVIGMKVGLCPAGAGHAWGVQDVARESRREGDTEQSWAPHGPPCSLPQDKQLTEVLAGAGNVVTLTIIPTVIYEHMVKR